MQHGTDIFKSEERASSAMKEQVIRRMAPEVGVTAYASDIEGLEADALRQAREFFGDDKELEVVQDYQAARNTSMDCQPGQDWFSEVRVRIVTEPVNIITTAVIGRGNDHAEVIADAYRQAAERFGVPVTSVKIDGGYRISETAAQGQLPLYANIAFQLVKDKA